MADRTLISGAKDVAQAKGSGNLAAAKAGMEVGGFLADNLGKMIQKRNHEFNRLMEAELEAAGEMTPEEQQEMIKRLKEKRGGYVLLNKRGMVNAEKELIEEADKIEKKIETKTKIIETFIDETEDKTPCDCIMDGLKETEDGWEIDPRTLWAIKNAPDEVMYTAEGKPYILTYNQAWENKDRDGNDLENPRFTVSQDGKTRTSIHGHIYPNTPEGQAIYRAHAESDWQSAGGQALDFTNEETLKETWYKSATYKDLENKDIKVVESWNSDNNLAQVSDGELENLASYLSMDRDSQTKIKTVVDAVTNDATAFVGGDTSKEFNYDAVRNNIMNNVINSNEANLRSLASDSIWGNTSWKTDMEEALTKGTYAQLGIESGDFEDPTPDDGITEADAKKITAEIMKNDKLLKETLGDYYTKIAEKNYNVQTGNNKTNNNNSGVNTDYE